MAPQFSAQPAPGRSLGYLSDYVPRRQTQLALLLRAVSGQDQHLCRQKRGSEGPNQSRLAMARVPGSVVRTAEEQGGGIGFCCHFHTVV